MNTEFLTLARQLNVDSLEALLVSALVMLERRGLARAGDVRLLAELKGGNQ